MIKSETKTGKKIRASQAGHQQIDSPKISLIWLHTQSQQLNTNVKKKKKSGPAGQ